MRNSFFTILERMLGCHKEISTVPTDLKTSTERKSRSDAKQETTNNVPTFSCPEYKKLSEYGYIRTIADIIKVLNEENHYTHPEELRNDLQETLEHYRERGTVSGAIAGLNCQVTSMLSQAEVLTPTKTVYPSFTTYFSYHKQGLRITHLMLQF